MHDRVEARLLTCYNVASSKVPGRCFSSPRRGTRMEVRMLEQSSLPFPAPEVWRPVPGFEGRYEVSDRGRVRSLRERGRFGAHDCLRPVPLILRAGLNRGYVYVHIASKMRKLHRLVLEVFVGPCPEGHEAAHLNGVRTDNHAENLAWKTHAENEHDKVVHGTVRTGDRNGTHTHPERVTRGESRPAAKLTAAAVREIRAAAGHGELRSAIAARHGVSTRTIRGVVRRDSWRHVP